MRPFALLTTLVLVSIPLAGCMGDGGSDYTPRTHEFTLEVKSGTPTIPLYTLNDGESQMMVAAVGFTTPEQDELEVPNPTIRVKEGDTVILTVINNNIMPHTLHLHGGLIPWEMDGVPFLTQMPIHQGESFKYTFKDLKAGTYFYHCHVDVAHHMDLGMYGAFIVEEVDPDIDFDREYVLMLDEWDTCHVHGNTDPVSGQETNLEFSQRADCFERFTQDNMRSNTAASAGTSPLCSNLSPEDPGYDELGCGHPLNPNAEASPREWYPMTFPVYTPIYNAYLINGKAFPDTKPLVFTEGETVKIRLINVGEKVHAMHIHGHNMLVTHRDGYQLDSPFRLDTLSIAPGERYDVIIEADNPGYWAFHDHVGLHVMNDDISPGGMFTCIAYDDFHGRDADTFERSIDCHNEAMKIFEEMGQGHDDHA